MIVAPIIELTLGTEASFSKSLGNKVSIVFTKCILKGDISSLI